MCLMASSVSAQNVTGNDILSACESTGDNQVQIGYCIGYITGAWEGTKGGAARVLMQAQPDASAAELDALSNTFLSVCYPSEATTSQAVDVFVRYLNNHPELRHQSARTLLVIAFNEAFPCE